MNQSRLSFGDNIQTLHGTGLSMRTDYSKSSIDILFHEKKGSTPDAHGHIIRSLAVFDNLGPNSGPKPPPSPPMQSLKEDEESF